MDVLQLLVTQAKPPVLVSPHQHPLSRPARFTQPFAIVDPLLGQNRLYVHVSRI